MKALHFVSTLLTLAGMSVTSHATLVPTCDFAGLWKAPSVIYIPRLRQTQATRTGPVTFPTPPDTDPVRWRFPSGTCTTLLGPVLKGDLAAEDLDFNLAIGDTILAFVYQDENGVIRPFSLSPSGPYGRDFQIDQLPLISEARRIIGGYSIIVLHAPPEHVPATPFAKNTELAAWLAQEALPTATYFDNGKSEREVFLFLAGTKEIANAAWEVLDPLYGKRKDDLNKFAWFNIAVHAQGAGALPLALSREAMRKIYLEDEQNAAWVEVLQLNDCVNAAGSLDELHAWLHYGEQQQPRQWDDLLQRVRNTKVLRKGDLSVLLGALNSGIPHVEYAVNWFMLDEGVDVPSSYKSYKRDRERYLKLWKNYCRSTRGRTGSPATAPSK